MASVETVETLELEIRTKANKAADEIARLASSVSDFGKEVGRHVSNLNDFAGSLERIVNAMKEMSSIKNLKNVIMSVAAVADTAKGKVTTPAVQQAVAAAKNGAWLIKGAPTTVKGGTRYAQTSDGKTIKYNSTARDIAKSLVKANNPYKITQKEITGVVQDARNAMLKGDADAAMLLLQSLASNIASSGQTRDFQNPIVKGLSSYWFGKGNGRSGSAPISLNAKDMAWAVGEYGSINKFNEALWNMGIKARFAPTDASGGVKSILDGLWGGLSTGRSDDIDYEQRDDGFNDLRRALAEKGLANTSNLEDVMNALKGVDFSQLHSAWLDMDNKGMSESEVAEHIFGQLLQDVFGATEIERESVQRATDSVSEAVKEAVSEAVEAGAEKAKEEVASAYKPRPGIRTFDEYTGKDWRAENAEDTAAFNARLGEIVNQKDALKNIRENTRELIKQFQEGGTVKKSVEGAAKSAVGESIKAANDAAKESKEEIIPGRAVTSLSGKQFFDMFNQRLGIGTKWQGSAEDAAKAFGPLFEELDEGAKKSIPLVNDLKQSFKGLVEMAKSGAIGNLAGQLWRVAKMRMLRYIVKQVAAGIKEGADNLYQWSKATNGHFASSLDTAATKLMLIKNSLITAVAPAIEAVIPLLGQLANVVNTVSNYFAQFLALITGKSSWTKATETAQEWAAATKTGAKAADKEIKDLLADWDELNIIQGESTDSGSGGTGKKATDTSGMFEEVYTFDENIRKLMDNINSVFGDALGLVKEIAVVMAAWKLSAAASGALATLASVIALGGLIKLNFDISTVLAKQFFDTGDEGWLIADVLTDVVGATLATKLALQIGKGTYAFAAVPVMLLVGVVARTLTMLKETDVSVLTPEALEANAISALEMGGAAAYIAWAAGASATQIPVAGAAATLITFGVLTGLKADVNAVRNARIDGEYIAGKALSSLSMSVGPAIAAKLLIPELSIGKAIGFGLATGAAATLLTAGVTLGITAAEVYAEEGKVTEAVIVETAGSSLAMGFGSALAIKMGVLGVHGLGWEVSAIGGAAATLFTLGAELGIMATIKAAKNDEITTETIVENAAASLLMGGGIAIAAHTIFGLTGTGVALAGGGVAIAAFAALIAIQAVLAQPAENGIVWGTNKLTSEEIQAFVNEEMFSVNVPATVQLIKGKIEPLSETDWKQIETDAAAMTSAVNVIKLGCATEDTYNNLKTALFGEDGNGGVIGDLKQYAKDQTAFIEVAFSLVPMTGENGETDAIKTAQYLKEGQLGWKEVYDEMIKAGQELGEALKAGSDESLDTYDDETILKLTEKVENIRRALQYSEIAGTAENKLMEGIAGLDKPTMDEIVKLYGEYRKELTDSFTDMEKELAKTYYQLASYWDSMGDAGKAEHYRNLGKDIYDSITENVEAAVDAASKSGREALHADLLEMIFGGVDEGDVWRALFAGDAWSWGEGYGAASLWGSAIDQLINPDGSDQTEAKNALREALGEMIKGAFGEDNGGFIIDAIDAGLLDYKDIIKGDIVNRLIETLGIKDGDTANRIREMFLNEFGIDTPKVVETEKPEDMLGDVIDELQEQADENPIQLSAELPDGTPVDDVVVGTDDTRELKGYDKSPEDVMKEAMEGWWILPGSEPITIDTAASGAASDSMLQNISTIVTTNMGDIQTTAQMMLRVLNWIAESSAETANKDMTVVISPSAALDKVNKRSARSGSKVTGVLALED